MAVTAYNNPCCCDCSLPEATIWIAAMEIIWNLINLLVNLSLYIQYDKAYNRVQGGGVVTAHELSLSQAFEKLYLGMIMAMILFGVGVAITGLLFMAVSKRVGGLCYAWIGAMSIITVGHIVNIVVHSDYRQLYSSIFWIFFDIYFAVVVAAFANEIKLYPDASTVIVRPVVMDHGPVIMTQPVYGGYGYGYPPGYGYGYGYHSGDAAVAGLALGMGAGMMMGGYGCDYGYGGCDMYDPCMF